MLMRVLRVDQNSKLWTLQPKQWTERCWNAQLNWWRTTESGNDFLWACQNDSLRLLLLCYFILCYYKILIRAALKHWFAGHYISCTHCTVRSSMHSLPKLRGMGILRLSWPLVRLRIPPPPLLVVNGWNVPRAPSYFPPGISRWFLVLFVCPLLGRWPLASLLSTQHLLQPCGWVSWVLSLQMGYVLGLGMGTGWSF